MAEPMSDERLAQLRSGNEPLGDHLSGLTADEVGELLAEVDRLLNQHAEDARTVGSFLARASHAELRLDAALKELAKLREEKAARTDLGGYAAPITFTEDENGHPQPQWPTP